MTLHLLAILFVYLCLHHGVGEFLFFAVEGYRIHFDHLVILWRIICAIQCILVLHFVNKKFTMYISW